jgi:hypothetical protein
VARQRIYLQGAQAVNCAETVASLPEPAAGTGANPGLALAGATTTTLQGTLATSAQLSGALAASVSELDRRSRNVTNQRLASLTTIAALQGGVLEQATVAADSALRNVAEQTPVLTSAERLDFAVDGIRGAVNSAILNTSVDAADALDAALSGVSGIPEQAKAAYEAARDAVEKKKEKAAETSATAEKVAEEAAGTDSTTETNALELQGLAEQIEANADEQLGILNTVLTRLEIETECAGDLR